MKSWKWTFLQNLVARLSVNEKRYLKVNIKRQDNDAAKNHIKIYHALENIDSDCSDIDFKKILPNKNISLEKAQFSKSLFKHLRNYNEINSTEISFHQALCDIEIIFSKQLYDFCLEYINHFLDRAYELQLYDFVLQFLRWKRKCISRLGNKKLHEKTITEIETIETDCIEQLRILSELRYIQQRTLLVINQKGDAFSPQDKTYVTSLLSESKITEADIKTTIGVNIYFEIKSWIAYYVENDKKKSFSYNKKMYEILLQNSHLIESNPQLFISVYVSYCARAYVNGNPDFETILEKIEDTYTDKSIPIPQDIRFFAFMFVSERKLIAQSDNQQYEKCIAQFKENEKIFKTNISLFKDAYLLLQYYFAALSYFHTREYTQALKYSKIIIDKFNDTTRLDYYVYNRILNILIHIELDNLTIISHLLGSLMRTVKKNELENSAVKPFLDLFNTIAKTKKLDNSAFLQAAIALDATSNNTKLAVIAHFNFNAWLHSKAKSTFAKR